MTKTNLTLSEALALIADAQGDCSITRQENGLYTVTLSGSDKLVLEAKDA